MFEKMSDVIETSVEENEIFKWLQKWVLLSGQLYLDKGWV
jgi:hypothetical protein